MTDQEGKDKISSILLAASALAELGSGSGSEEEESTKAPVMRLENPALAPRPESADSTEQGGDKPAVRPLLQGGVQNSAPKVRHLPLHKKPNAALTFPEKLMQMMTFAEEHGKGKPDYCIAWMKDGKSFVVRHPEKFTNEIVPLFFKQTKFSSFTRKLYRWGFYQVYRGNDTTDSVTFSHCKKYFQRDAKQLMAKMQSITATNNSAPKARLSEQMESLSGTKRKAREPLGGQWSGMGSSKRALMLQRALDTSMMKLGNTSAEPRPCGMLSNQQITLADRLRAAHNRRNTLMEERPSGIPSNKQMTLADRLRAAHNRPSLRPAQSPQQFDDAPSASFAREAAIRRFVQKDNTGFSGDSDLSLGHKVNLTGGGAFPLTSMMFPGAGAGYPNSRSSAAIVKAAVDALRNAA